MKDIVIMQQEMIKNIFRQYGYMGLDDVIYYSQQNDIEAISLLNFYRAVDDYIWNEIKSGRKDIKIIEEGIQKNKGLLP